MVAGVGDEEIIRVGMAMILNHALWRRELAGAVALPPERKVEGAVGVEHLDAMVAGVGDEYIQPILV